MRPLRASLLLLSAILQPTSIDADAASSADGGLFGARLLGNVLNAPVVCEESFDVSTSGGATGASRCNVVTGSLVLSGGLPGRFARGASSFNIERIDGDFVVRANAVETSLRGAFPGLTQVGGSVVIENTRLVYLSVFPSLAAVGGSVRVVNNARLLAFGDAETAAFPALTSVGGDVEIRGNAARECDGFHALKRVGAHRVSGGSVLIRDSPALVELMAPRRPLAGKKPPFHALEAVWGDVEVSNNGGLREIRGMFRSLVYVTGAVRIQGNPSLSAITNSFPLLDAVGEELSIADDPSLAKVSRSLLVLRDVGGDVRLTGDLRLTSLDRGTLNGLRQVRGSLFVAQTRLVSLAFLFSLASVFGDVRLSSNPDMRSLDGLQNLRFVGGGLSLQNLEGNYGRCGLLSEKTGVTHRCYEQQYRFCQPLVDNHKLASGSSSTVPGWYSCVDSIMTSLLLTQELRSTASVVLNAGLADALQTPSAALTMFAPTDIAWLRSHGRLDNLLNRANAGTTSGRDLVFAHLVRGVRKLRDFVKGETVHTLLLGLAVKVRATGFLPLAPAKISRCKAQPGVWDACTPEPHRKIVLEPRAWLPLSAGQLTREKYFDVSSTDEMLAAYQRGAMDDKDTEGDDASAEGDEAGEDEDEDVSTRDSSSTSKGQMSDELFAKATAAAAEWSGKTFEAFPLGAARTVLGNIKAGNGYLHVIDAPLAPDAVLLPAPPPRPPAPRSPPGQTQQSIETLTAAALLATSPPLNPAVYVNAPPPVLTPMSSYFQARPPPPGYTWSRSPPPFGAFGRGSCKAREPNICGLCDYTHQDVPVEEGGGVCCCDPTCEAPENGDCCADYRSTCGDGGAPQSDAFRVRANASYTSTQ